MLAKKLARGMKIMADHLKRFDEYEAARALSAARLHVGAADGDPADKPELVWDDEWCCWYDPVEAEAIAAAEAAGMVDANGAMWASVNASEPEPEPELEPEPEPVRFAEYELDRLRTMVANARWLLGTAQAELRNASAFSSHTHRAFLQQELRKAESLMETAQLEYERAAAQCM